MDIEEGFGDSITPERRPPFVMAALLLIQLSEMMKGGGLEG
jgi:hypothetical protein